MVVVGVWVPQMGIHYFCDFRQRYRRSRQHYFFDLGVWRSAKFVKTKFSSGKSEITIKKVSPLRGELIIFGVGLSECGLKRTATLGLFEN